MAAEARTLAENARRAESSASNRMLASSCRGERTRHRCLRASTISAESKSSASSDNAAKPTGANPGTAAVAIAASSMAERFTCSTVCEIVTLEAE